MAEKQQDVSPGDVEMEGEMEENSSRASSVASNVNDVARKDSISSSDSSFAVNCAAFPTEVIVHGRSVQKVRVLFTPQPPRKSTSEERESCPSSVRRRSRKSTLTSSISQVADDSSVPYSQEESTWPMDITNSATTATASVGPLYSFPRVSSLPATLASKDFGFSSVDDAHLKGLDQKVHLDIINGLQYLERRKEELYAINNRLSVELDCAKQECDQLREDLNEVTSKARRLDHENDELKEKLDKLEKEKIQVTDQVLSEWNARVKLEEHLMEFKRDSENEAKKLKELINNKEAELRLMESHIMNNNNQRFSQERETNAESLEILHKIVRLEDTIAQLQTDKERSSAVNYKLEQETSKWKGCFQDKCREFEVQISRFQALKKSFSDVMAENERLKSQTKLLHKDVTIANQTWPSINSHSDTIKVLDLPDSKMQGSLNGIGASALGGVRATVSREKMCRQGGGIRKKSDASNSSNENTLPPVLRNIK